MEPWRDLARENDEVHYLALRASKEETIRRAVGCSKLDKPTNVELVETMWEQFCGLGVYESHVVETTNASIRETVCAVKEKIASGAARLSDTAAKERRTPARRATARRASGLMAGKWANKIRAFLLMEKRP